MNKNHFLDNPTHKNTILRKDTTISNIPIKENQEIINNVYNNNFPKGVINPIKKKEITTLISLDSIFRKNYNITNSTNYMVDLPEPVNNVISMELVSLEIPNIMYYISEKSKTNKISYQVC